MGMARITIDVVGNHGHDRKPEAGEEINMKPCGVDNCVDCQAIAIVAGLREKNHSVEAAKLIHWPNDEVPVVDDLLTGKRESGSF